MPLPPALSHLRLPVIGSPMFIVGNPRLVIAQCTAGIVGSMPSLNARPASLLDDWLAEITEVLAAWDRQHPDQPAAPYAINQIVHKSNDRLDHDMAACAKYKVPIVISSLGARTDINEAVHGWGGIVLHDIINNAFAHKAIDKGADGLIAVAAGAGGHASDEIVYTSLFTGVHGNYLKPSIRAAGLDPDNLEHSDPSQMSFGSDYGAKKAWKDIWGCGQGIGAVQAVVPAAQLVARLRSEYEAARVRLVSH